MGISYAQTLRSLYAELRTFGILSIGTSGVVVGVYVPETFVGKAQVPLRQRNFIAEGQFSKQVIR